MSSPYKILFVCMGNICRSPSAECIFRTLAERAGFGDQLEIDSAGTIGFHAGSPPDHRMTEAAAKRNFILTGRSRPLSPDDLERFDLIIGMDDENMSGIKALVSDGTQTKKIKRMTDYCRNHSNTFVPDPYYGGRKGFDDVIALLEDACEGLLESLQEQGILEGN